MDPRVEELDSTRPARGPAPTNDVVWCGLCLHHLEYDDKLDALRAMRAKTNQICLIYEPTRSECESGEAFMSRFSEFRESWTALSSRDWRDLSTDVMTCNFPEEPYAWLDLGLTAGFSKATRIFISDPHFSDLFRFDD